MPENLRTVRVFRDEQWIDVQGMSEIRKGEKFKLYEPDNTPVADPKGRTEFIALSDPFQNENGVWSIEVEK